MVVDPVRHLQPHGLLTGVAARRVLGGLMRTGLEARFVGGCVRDTVLGIEPNDVDIATPLRPDEVMRRLKADGLRVVPTGIKHGTVTAVVEGQTIEVTTLRRDISTDGRRATVEFTEDWEEDAARRDFTFNAMSLTPEGELYDPYDGMGDLEEGRVRFIGDPRQRIQEDVLRILRFFRFHARFGQDPPDPDAIAACKELCHLIPNLSGERVRDELLKILESDRAIEVWRLMLKTGVAGYALPAADRIERFANLDRLEWLVGPCDVLARLASLLPDDAEVALDVAARLRLSVPQRERLRRLAAPPVTVQAGMDERQRRHALQVLGPEDYRDLLMLRSADAKTPAVELLEPLAEAGAWHMIPFPLQGQDAVDRGIPPGPRIGELLDQVEAWWRDKDYRPDRDACLGELELRIQQSEPVVLPPPSRDVYEEP